ncbi:MAG: PD-(D/E)XK nuclease family protein [Tepidiformaceae bacterium]
MRFERFGADAARALREAIAAAKLGDALAPVTVVTPSNYAGLSLRRVLGRDGGLVNVRFMVMARVAELLGAPLLVKEGKRPLTKAVSAEAVRNALQTTPGFFESVKGHVATEKSLATTFKDLRRIPGAQLGALAQSGRRARDVVAIFREFQETAKDYYDETELARAAAVAVRQSSAALRDLGRMIVFLPRDMTPAEAELVTALKERGEAEVILGVAGDRQADSVTSRIARTLGASLEAGDQRHTVKLGETQIVAVTDPEEEVRTVLRMIAAAVGPEAPLHRMAVLYRTVEPYALLTHEQFAASGVPHNGPSIARLGQSLAGRALSGVLGLRGERFRRDAVMDWLTCAPIRIEEGGAPVPAQRWDVLTRSAGITVGERAWKLGIERHVRARVKQAEALEGTGEDPDRAERLRAESDLAKPIAAFIEELAVNTVPPSEQTWTAFAGWCAWLLDRYLGNQLWLSSRDSDLNQRGDQVEVEKRAFDDVKEAVAGLAALDKVAIGAAAVTETVFRHALERVLEAPGARLGPFGDGVFVGPLASATGMQFDTVYVLGMVEGQMPPVGRDDPLLPDVERKALGGAMPLRGSRRAEERRDYVAALASARHQVLLFPRADLRSQSQNLPARWLLEAATDLASESAGLYTSVFTRQFERLQESAGPRGNGWLRSFASFRLALERSPEPGSQQEYDLRSLVLAHPVRSHFLVRDVRQVRDGIEASTARGGTSVTVWDGKLASDEHRAPSKETPTSPTSLEIWAKCPFRYFLKSVLRVAETEKPEETLTMGAAERGTLVHAVLQTFFAGSESFAAVAARTTKDQPWTAAEHAYLRSIAEWYFADAEASGLTGKLMLWAIEKRRILRNLELFLDEERLRRRQTGFVFASAELAFGMKGGAPLVVRLGDGREVTFRGSIDRVERTLDGSRVAVVDYKTGSNWDYKAMADRPLMNGKLLQLPVYGLAAAAALGAERVQANYWFISEKEKFALKGYEVAQGEPAEFVETLAKMVDGIEAGVFPAHPGKRDDFHRSFDNCGWCPYDSLCARDRDRAWRRKIEAPEIAEYINLIEPEADDDD